MDLSNYVLFHIPSVLKLSGLIVSKELYLRDLSDPVNAQKLKSNQVYAAGRMSFDARCSVSFLDCEL